MVAGFRGMRPTVGTYCPCSAPILGLTPDSVMVKDSKEQPLKSNLLTMALCIPCLKGHLMAFLGTRFMSVGALCWTLEMDDYFHRQLNSTAGDLGAVCLWPATFRIPDTLGSGVFNDLEHLVRMNCGYQRDSAHEPVKRMLQLDADLRIEPLKILQHLFFTPLRAPILRPGWVCLISDCRTREMCVRWHMDTTKTVLLVEETGGNLNYITNDPKELKVADIQPATKAASDKSFKRIMVSFNLQFTRDEKENTTVWSMQE